jgi:hypothetical protein
MTDETVNLREELPVVARHEGVWEGQLLQVDPDLEGLELYETSVVVDLSGDRGFPYYQQNRYEWPDGSEETHELPGEYSGGRIVYDTTYVQGEAWEAAHDDRSVIVTWTRPREPDCSFHEIITINDAGDERARVWQLFDEKGLRKWTVIEEHRVE